MNKNNFLLGLFLLVLYFVWYLYKPFLLQIAIASLLAIATSTLYLYFNKKVQSPILKATFLTIILGLIFFAPIVYALNSLAHFVNNFDIDFIEKIVQLKKKFILPEYLSFLKPYIKDFLENINVATISSKIFKYATMILKGSAGFVKDMVIILIFYFFSNLYAKELISYFTDVLPFEKNSLFFAEISSVMNLVFYSTIITAIFEGALFAIIAMVYGYNGLLFGILYGFSSLIPIVGGLLLWLPLSLYQYSLGDTFGSLVIAGYSIIVISFIADTLIKPLIIDFVNQKALTSKTNINSLVIFFSMVAGLSTFGFWGIILGPAITTFFISFLKIYHKVLHEES